MPHSSGPVPNRRSMSQQPPTTTTVVATRIEPRVVVARAGQLDRGEEEDLQRVGRQGQPAGRQQRRQQAARADPTQQADGQEAGHHRGAGQERGADAPRRCPGVGGRPVDGAPPQGVRRDAERQQRAGDDVALGRRDGPPEHRRQGQAAQGHRQERHQPVRRRRWPPTRAGRRPQAGQVAVRRLAGTVDDHRPDHGEGAGDAER